jgi:hypothetical protein
LFQGFLAFGLFSSFGVNSQVNSNNSPEAKDSANTTAQSWKREQELVEREKRKSRRAGTRGGSEDARGRAEPVASWKVFHTVIPLYFGSRDGRFL